MLENTEIGESIEPCEPRVTSVLIVEDDGLLSMMMEDLMREAGAVDVLLCRTAAEAVRHAAEAEVDCAVLDVFMSDDSTYAAADLLAARNIPFLFCTGLRPDDLAERHRHRPLLAKPYSDAQFRDRVAQALAQRSTVPAEN